MPPPPDPRATLSEHPSAQLSAILLAGGRGSRLGGVQKALLRRGEQTQIQRWVFELRRRGIRTVVVGPRSLRPEIPTSVPLVQESPAFAGPAAGVLAGALQLQRSDPRSATGPETTPASASTTPSAGWTLLLAVDLTEPAALLDWLLGQLEQAHIETGAETPGTPAAVLPSDAGGRRQYLSAAVPTDWLVHRTRALAPSEAEHRPVRWLLQSLQESAALHHPVLPHGLSDDVDTVDDALRLGVSLP